MLAFDQRFDPFAQVLRIDLRHDTGLQVFQHFVSFALFFFGHIVFQAASADGLRTRAVAGQVRLVQLQLFQQRISLHELPPRFARKTDDDIGIDRDMRDDFADLVDQLAILASRVTAPHLREHFIRARLHRHFDMWHDARQLGNSVQQLVAHPVGVAGQEANPLHARLLGGIMHNPQQVRQVGTIGDIFAIAVDNLPQQRNFFDALPRQTANMRDNLANAPAAFNAAPERDDAKGAGVRTAIDDRHMRADQLPAFVQGQHQLAILQGIAFLTSGIFQLQRFGFMAALAQKIQHRRRVGGWHKDIDIGQPFAHPQRVAHADHAAHHADDLVGLLALQLAQHAESTQPLVLGALPHHAGIDDHDVGFIAIWRGAMTQLFQLGCQQLRVGNIHLAAESPNVILHGHDLYCSSAIVPIVAESGRLV